MLALRLLSKLFDLILCLDEDVEHNADEESLSCGDTKVLNHCCVVLWSYLFIRHRYDDLLQCKNLSFAEKPHDKNFIKLILYDSCTEMAVDMTEHHHKCLLHFCISRLNRSTGLPVVLKFLRFLKF